jgi:ribonuclease BN (tRNA processing enzyme)
MEEFKNYQKDDEDIIITAHKTFAHPKNGCLCYKIQYQDKILVYATDKESYVGSDKKFIEFAKDADLLIHDSQYTTQEYSSSISPRQGFGHSTFKMAIETAKLANVKQLALFHYDPNYDDNFLKSIEGDILKNTENVFFSREGLEVTL